MIRFTIVKGKIVLDPNIVLFKALDTLYKMKRGEKLLQVISFTHSRENDNPFKNVSQIVLEENILQAVFNKATWEELKITKAEQIAYDDAEDVFIKFNQTSESRLERSINKKLDEISDMLDETKPRIEQNYTKSGEIKFTSNLGIILNLFTKIETIMKGKTILQNAIMKQESAGKVKGGGTTSFRERNMLEEKK